MNREERRRWKRVKGATVTEDDRLLIDGVDLTQWIAYENNLVEKHRREEEIDAEMKELQAEIDKLGPKTA